MTAAERADGVPTVAEAADEGVVGAEVSACGAGAAGTTVVVMTGAFWPALQVTLAPDALASVLMAHERTTVTRTPRFDERWGAAVAVEASNVRATADARGRMSDVILARLSRIRHREILLGWGLA